MIRPIDHPDGDDRRDDHSHASGELRATLKHFDLEPVPDKTVDGGPADAEGIGEGGHAVEPIDRTCPICRHTSEPGAVLCTHCGYRFDAGRRERTQTDRPAYFGRGSWIARFKPDWFDPQETAFTDLDLPLLLLVLSPVLFLVATAGPIGWLDTMTAHLTLGVPAVFAGLSGLFMFTGGGEGSLLGRLFKCAAMTLGGGGLVDAIARSLMLLPIFAELGQTVMPFWLGSQLLVSVVVYPPLLAAIFDTDAIEAIFGLIVMLLLRNAAMHMVLASEMYA